jgi:cytochrome P450
MCGHLECTQPSSSIRSSRMTRDALQDDEQHAARHPHAFLAFGSGPRQCVGMKYALQEGVVTLARIWQHFNVQLAPRQEPLKTTAEVTLAPTDGVKLLLWRRRGGDLR